ncbi:hypothetical protein LTR28_006466 [Elasticomyces elasticus]|nr:hypothetical protein LTR28_006466 [Elasticomyces elasticus]
MNDFVRQRHAPAAILSRKGQQKPDPNDYKVRVDHQLRHAEPGLGQDLQDLPPSQSVPAQTRVKQLSGQHDTRGQQRDVYDTDAESIENTTITASETGDPQVTEAYPMYSGRTNNARGRQSDDGERHVVEDLPSQAEDGEPRAFTDEELSAAYANFVKQYSRVPWNDQEFSRYLSELESYPTTTGTPEVSDNGGDEESLSKALHGSSYVRQYLPTEPIVPPNTFHTTPATADGARVGTASRKDGRSKKPTQMALPAQRAAPALPHSIPPLDVTNRPSNNVLSTSVQPPSTNRQGSSSTPKHTTQHTLPHRATHTLPLKPVAVNQTGLQYQAADKTTSKKRQRNSQTRYQDTGGNIAAENQTPDAEHGRRSSSSSRTPTNHGVDESESRLRLDHEPSELYKMDYADLRHAPFDVDPNAGPPLIGDHEFADLPEKLHHVAMMVPDFQTRFFALLNVDEWENAGDWFLDQFSDIVQRMKMARKEKRQLAKGFEDEIERRHSEISRKLKAADEALEAMRTSGQTVLQGTPKKKKRTLH